MRSASALVGLAVLSACGTPPPSEAPIAAPRAPPTTVAPTVADPTPIFDPRVARLVTPLAELSEEELVAVLVAGGWSAEPAHRWALGVGPWGQRGRASQIELAIARDQLTGSIRLLQPSHGPYRSDHMDDVEASVAEGGYAVQRQDQGVIGVLLAGHPTESAALLAALVPP